MGDSGRADRLCHHDTCAARGRIPRRLREDHPAGREMLRYRGGTLDRGTGDRTRMRDRIVEGDREKPELTTTASRRDPGGTHKERSERVGAYGKRLCVAVGNGGEVLRKEVLDSDIIRQDNCR